MSATTTIEWTDATWNPVTGCTEVSEGCDHCYAKTFAERWRGAAGHYFASGFDVRLRRDKLDAPLRWRRPRRIFVNSMSDLFHKDVPDEFIARVFAVMAACPQHTFQLLTKRPGRMRALLNDDGFAHRAMDESLVIKPIAMGAKPHGDTWPLPNLWAGVSVENQKWADVRIPLLLDTDAAVRWISAEPLLGPIQLGNAFPWLDWVVAGGESGTGARPMDPNWVRLLRNQCDRAGAPFLFKQWGAWTPAGYGIGMTRHDAGREVLVGDPVDDRGFRQVMRRVGKHAGGRELDGRTHDQYPEPNPQEGGTR